MKTMQFAAYGGSEQLAFNDIPEPAPGPGEILVAVHAAAINPIDWKLHGGMLRWIKPIRFPSTPCFDFAGVVEALGPGVTSHTIGDRVFGMLALGPNGAAAEAVCVAASLAARLPDDLGFHQAAGMPLAGMTALQAMRDYGRLQAGQELLVVGAAGGVGHYAVQLGKALGARVTGICSAGNMALVRELGADEVLDYTAPDFALPAKCYDVILDAVTSRPFSTWQPALAETGTYISLLPTLDLGWQWLRLSLSSRQRIRLALVKPKLADLDLFVQLAREKRFRTVIEATFPLRDLGKALEQSRTGRTRGKVIVETRR